MKKPIFLVIAGSLAMVCLTGCGCDKQTAISLPESGESENSAISVSSATTTTHTTAILLVTNTDGSAVTDTAGSFVTTQVQTLPTETRNVTDASGSTVTNVSGAAVTEAYIPPVITVSINASGHQVTTKIQENTTAPEQTTGYVSTGSAGRKSTATTTKPPVTTAKPTTTKRPITTAKPTTTKRPITTAKPTTTRLPVTTAKPTTTKPPATTAKPTTTKPPVTTAKPTTTATLLTRGGVPYDYENPWKFPYDVNYIVNECKKEIIKAGLQWDESLTIEDSCWNNPTRTTPCTFYPDECSLQYEIMDDVLPCEIREKIQIKRKRAKVVFKPYSGLPGDYEIYFLCM